jgi:adenosyl cobinamide kinase/adenosyl cobinamide phosphate guanylyltransferase
VPIVLVLGGTRSGKSAVAERLAAAAGGPVTYLATATVTDDAMAARVHDHRARRPPEWTTVECGSALVDAVRAARGTVLVDSLGTWVAGHWDQPVDADALVGALTARGDDLTVVVSEEVGMAVHPESAVGRRFVDVIGSLNHAVSAVSDRVALVVAGRVLWLPEITE